MQIDLQQEFYGNSVREYLFVLAAIVIAYIVLQIIKRWLFGLVRRLSGKTHTQYDDMLVTLLEKFVIPYIYLVINFNLLRTLRMPPKLDQVLDVALTAITVIFAVRLINHFIHDSLQTYVNKRDEGLSRMKQLSGVLIVVKVIIWTIGLIFFLDNVGFDVTTVIAGLGVGGIAVALAAQNILSDLFSYFVIFFDKPFEIGDFIVVGDKMGTVERIGIKTSHVRSLGGEQLVMPNADLVKSTIHNFKRQEKRRVVFKVGVEYDTPQELLQQVPTIIREAIIANQLTTFDRAHLLNFGDFSINYEAVYYIQSADYNTYMDISQALHFTILQEFGQRGIEIAFPTQKLLVHAQPVKQKADASAIISSTNISELKAGNERADGGTEPAV